MTTVRLFCRWFHMSDTFRTTCRNMKLLPAAPGGLAIPPNLLCPRPAPFILNGLMDGLVDGRDVQDELSLHRGDLAKVLSTDSLASREEGWRKERHAFHPILKQSITKIL